MGVFWSVVTGTDAVFGAFSMAGVALVIVASVYVSIRDRRVKRRDRRTAATRQTEWRQRIRDAHNEEHRSGSPLNERWPA